ncbi:hypothetical protein [Microbacterium sp. SL75]|uniref:hypothetical protein n=1 Tax=Microbacterium sp. SL75 TaxID=2995140 RepID=UPI00226ED3A2|nr:hypothetical protein [Microbacterium sp. SL75]WAC69387.1 hypothetical protein OVA17_01440 [Microbacterium sp. SL75]
MIFGKRRHEQTAQQREELKAAAAEQGWRWSDAQPAPAFELSEAALRGPERFKIWTVGLGDVVDGMVNTRPFRAARLIGYDYTTTNGGIPYGDRRETSAVWIDLPDSLPEIRLVDASSTEKDEGLPLPPLNPARTTDGRWRVEGFVPQFASDLLHSTFVTALATLPPLTAVVIRAGMILAYGLQRYDAQTIRTVATTLAALIEAVPGNAWGRADALVAGTGVFPRRVPGGASLSLDQRLVRPDWKGFGLAEKVPWPDAPGAPKNVMLKRSEAVEVWEPTPDDAPGFSLSAQFGRATIGSGMPLGIPTVASTISQGGAAPRA